MRMRLDRAGARLAVGLVLAAVFAGCGHGSGGASSGASPVTTVRSPAMTTVRPSAASTTMVTGVAIGAGGGKAALLVIPRCVPAGVEVSLDIQPRSGSQAATWTRALLVVTAVSAAPCRLEGFAQIGDVLGSSLKPVVVQWVATERGSGVVTVRTGASGFAALGWRSRPGCPQVDGFEVVLPGERAETKVEVVGAVGLLHALAVCGGEAELGPFVASADLANAEEFMPPTR